MIRVGMLTSGGDCQGLNAALRGVAKALYETHGNGVEVVGIRDGYRGLIENEWDLMNPGEFSGILTLGGTVLGTSRQPFKKMGDQLPEGGNRVDRMLDSYRKMKLDALVILGGNGTHKTADLLSREGLPIVTLPKTIDNDLWGTDTSFGFQSAVDVASYVIDCLHSTATSHGRVFLVELMGHKAGWLTLHAGLAGGADVILIPEIPYNADRVADALERRQKEGKRFSIVAVAEGALSLEEAALGKKELKAARAAEGSPSVAYRLARAVEQRMGQEIRVAVPGHVQRGGSPCAYDRVLATRLGVAAARMIREEQFGCMAAVRNGEIVPVPLDTVAGKLKTVPPDCGSVASARELGIELGDQ